MCACAMSKKFVSVSECVWLAGWAAGWLEEWRTKPNKTKGDGPIQTNRCWPSDPDEPLAPTSARLQIEGDKTDKENNNKHTK